MSIPTLEKLIKDYTLETGNSPPKITLTLNAYVDLLMEYPQDLPILYPYAYKGIPIEIVGPVGTLGPVGP